VMSGVGRDVGRSRLDEGGLLLESR